MVAARQEVNKQTLYGNFQKHEDRRAKFVAKVAHKAADVAMDDDVNITNTRTGIGTAGAIGIGAAAGIPGIITALALMFGGRDSPQPQAPAQQVSPGDSEYDVLFYDKDGNLIPVQRKAN
jgi:hypothetical protein